MRYRDILGISLRMLRTNWLRSLLTILGIGVAISTIVVLVGFGLGVQNITIGSITKSKSLLSLDVQANEGTSQILDKAAAAEIGKLSGVQDVSPVYLLEGQVTVKGKMASISVKAGTPSYVEMEGVKIDKGRAFTADEKSVVVAPQTLEMLDIAKADAIGKKIAVKIVHPDSPSTMIPLGDLAIGGVTDGATPDNYLANSLIEATPGIRPNAVKVQATDRDAVVETQAALVARGYQVDSLLSTLDDARRVFRWATVGLVVIAMIALVVAAIGMFNVLTIALLERTREVGVMKAIGITNGSIRKLFLTESLLIGALGGVAGIMIGLGVSSTFNLILSRLASHYGTNSLDLFQFTPLFLIGMAVFPAALGIVTGLYPAIRATRISPLVALRYE